SDSQSYPSMISYQDSTIFVNGKSPSGWGNTSNTAWGAYTDTGATIQLSTTTMNVSANNCYGLYANGTDINSTPSTINFQGSSIVLDGDVVKGAFVENGGLVILTGEGENSSSNHPFHMTITGRNSSNPSYGLYADSQGSIQVSEMDIFMDAPLAVGAQAIAKDSSITLDGVNMHFSRPNAVGVGLESGSTVTLKASTLMNKEALGKKKRTRRALRLSQDSIYPAIYSGVTGADESNSLRVTDGSIGGNFTHLIYVDQSHLEATFQGSSAVSSNLQAPLCHVTKDSLVTMQAYDNASLTGDLEGEGSIKLSLLNNASWSGKRSEELKPLVQLEIGQNALWKVTGSSSIDQVNNQRGTIEMTPIKDAAATFLEIHEYQGIGGNVILNTALGFNNSPSDLIQINHYTATSPTVVTIQNQSAPQKMVLSHTVPLIKVAKSEPLDEGAFTFNQFINGERYNYTFQYDPHDPLWHVWGLQLEEKTSHTPLYVALPSLALSYNLSLIDTFRERMGSLSYSKEASKVWSRYSYQKGDSAQKLQGSVIKRIGYSYTNQTFQVGSTLLSMKHQNGYQDDIGIYGAFGEAANHVPLEKASSGKSGMNIQSAATYWTHFGPLGEYLDTVIQGSYYRSQLAALENPSKTTGFGITGSLEGGIPFQIEPGFFIEPEVQMISQLMHLHSFAEENGRIHLKNISSFVTRLGLRLAKDWMLSEKKLSLWARVSDYYEWLEGAKVTLDSSMSPTTFSSEPLKSWGEFNLGIDAYLSPAVSLYGTAGYSTDFSASHAQDIQVGIKLRW
ncbi:MAG: autotransporter outer membrane beta-barrel domain-containing protein, partial [Candidatus Rhabdochlamydia sp.]